ncbi:DoxX family protein [Pseudorhodoplanes sinuspersici]|uniref:Uncharacterized protein n=1 Tax=Pseudorhodoplanes sinuspersici TaxID=1235591 RepID=A0A1W6ZYF0_9HYPH|nr:DoxX family protein [Pseudorhodoplanes sinuspersici]ARQ02364.1 hypothetical protein CAK95_27100 [Pseudorhodoplanes sinuspersici]RKE74193.1 DoxX-like protein [Pseudorhodoplanes sinuspersici]
MMSAASWGVWLTWLLALLFVVNGIANLFNPKPFRDDFARWQFPGWFFLFNGAFQIATGLLLVFEQTRWLGFALAVVVCLGVYATLIRFREFSHMGPITVLSALVLLAMWRIWG